MENDLLKHRDLIEKYLKKSPRSLSSFSFTGIFIWKDFFNFKWQLIDGNLCIFAQNDLGSFMYLPPLGDRVSLDTVEECFKIMHASNKGRGVSRIENVEEERLRLFDPNRFSYFRKSDEYIYLREDIASFKGNLFKSKRASYNHFIKNYRFEFLPFEEGMQKECEALYEDWAQGRVKTQRDEIYREMIKDNRAVHRLAIKNYKNLDLIGHVVRIEDKIKGYTFGFVLNKNTFCVLFEIVDLVVKGLSTYIFREFCASQEGKKFKMINVMDDFGLENIKQTKLSFRPHQIIPSYVVSKKEGQ